MGEQSEQGAARPAKKGVRSRSLPLPVLTRSHRITFA